MWYVGGGFLPFQYVFLLYCSKTILMIIYIYTKILKYAFKTRFSPHNNHLNLNVQVENLEWLVY